jgi:hypothetical protein
MVAVAVEITIDIDIKVLQGVIMIAQVNHQVHQHQEAKNLDEDRTAQTTILDSTIMKINV